MDDSVNVALAGLADMYGAGAATTFHKAHNGDAMRVTSRGCLARALAIICLVNLNRLALTTQRRQTALSHGEAQAMGDKPRGLEGAAQRAVKLVGAHALFAAAHEVGGLKPQVKRQAAFLENRAL